MGKPPSGSQSHLTPVVYHTLLVLSGEPLHGYAISQAVERLTEGQVRMGPGTLYGTLKKLHDAGWLEPTVDVHAQGAHATRRRYYRLTTAGSDALKHEAQRLTRAVELAMNYAVLDG